MVAIPPSSRLRRTLPAIVGGVYWVFLAQSEKLNLVIMQQFATKDIRFALPTWITDTSTDARPQPPDVTIT